MLALAGAREHDRVGGAPLHRPGRTRGPAGQGPPPRPPRHSRPAGVRAGGTADQPRRGDPLHRPAAGAPQHRGGGFRFPRRRDGSSRSRRLVAAHDVVAIAVDDPRERRLPDAGWIELEDAETGRRVAGRHRRPRSAGPAGRRVRPAPRRAGPDALAPSVSSSRRVDMASDYGIPLRRAFARRARRRRR